MDVVSYKCPNCAAGLAFDIESQSWDCKFCGSSFTLRQLEEQTPGEQAPATTAPEPELESPHDSYGEGAAAFICPSCGGHIVTDQNTAATFCVYCHNPTVLAARLDKEYRPARLIPFKIEKDKVMEALMQFCRKRPLLPKDFRHFARKGEVSGLYVPFWLFDSDVDAQLQGMGHIITTWSDSNYRYTKTDTYQVERKAHLVFRGIPADGSQRMEDHLMEALEPYDYGQMVDFTMGYLSGHLAESYDVDANQAGKRAMPRMRASVEKLMREQVRRYTRFDTTNMSSQSKNTRSTYVMLPVWILNADYAGKRYTFAMNGQTGKITGALPMSWGLFARYFAGIWAALSAVLFVGGLIL